MAGVGRITELWREAADALAEPRDALRGWEACEVEVARLRESNKALLAHRATIQGVIERAEQAEAECGRLREQLDADQERAAILSSIVGRARLYLSHGDAKAAQDALDHAAQQTRALLAARAALGVVGEQEQHGE